MGSCWTRRADACIARLNTVHSMLEETVKKYDFEIDKCASDVRNPLYSRSMRLGALRRQKVFSLYRERAQKRMCVILSKICAIEDLESTQEEIRTYQQVTRLFRATPSVEKVEEMTEKLNTLTDDLCEISSLLEAPEIGDLDEEDLKEEVEFPDAPTHLPEGVPESLPALPV